MTHLTFEWRYRNGVRMSGMNVRECCRCRQWTYGQSDHDCRETGGQG